MAVDLDRIYALAKLHAHSVFYTSLHLGYDCHELLPCVTCREGGEIFGQAFASEIQKVEAAHDDYLECCLDLGS